MSVSLMQIPFTNEQLYNYILTSYCVFTRLSHNAGTLTISHNVHCFDSEVDVSPQLWKCVLTQALRITTCLCHINGNALITDIAAYTITKYIWLHCSYVESEWRIPFEMLVPSY